VVVGEEETNAYSDDLNSTSSLSAAPPFERLEVPDAEEGEELLPDLPDPDLPPDLPDPDLPDPLSLPLDDGRPLRVLLLLLPPRADGRLLLLTTRREGADVTPVDSVISDGVGAENGDCSVGGNVGGGVVVSANEERTGDGVGGTGTGIVMGDGFGNKIGTATGDGVGTGITSGDSGTGNWILSIVVEAKPH